MRMEVSQEKDVGDKMRVGGGFDFTELQGHMEGMES